MEQVNREPFLLDVSRWAWEQDVMVLTWEERGVYLELLRCAWINFGTIPERPEILARLLAIHPRTFKRIWRSIGHLWVKSGKPDRLASTWLAKELAYYESERRGRESGTRRIVFERDNHTCQYCGATNVPLHVDHVHPRSRGGNDDMENLTTACGRCNSSKGNKTLDEWVRPEWASPSMSVSGEGGRR